MSTGVTYSPAVDANMAAMLSSNYWGTRVDVTVSGNATAAGVPNGNYLVYLYCAEDSGPETFTFLLEGNIVAKDYNSGPRGYWQKLGPFPVSITDGALNIGTVGPATLSGIEIYRVNAPVFTVNTGVDQGLFLPQSTLSLTGQVTTPPASSATRVYARTVGQKVYELKDHLGNVRVLVSDQKRAELISGSIVERALVTGYNNYYPFGLKQSPASYAATSQYRYGFNGKEQDQDFNNNYDYGFRIYNPSIAKFLSVDPLTKEYPWYTPYQFAGNMPIKYIDLDGLEPANNPKTPGFKEQKAMAVVIGIETGAAEQNMRHNSLNPFSGDSKLLGTEYCKGTSDYITDTNKESANKLNMYVSNASIFKVDESNAGKMGNYESFIVKTLMENMVDGTGPENYEFPLNGIISSQFLDSDILVAALKSYKNGDHKSGNAIQYSFGARELAKDTWRNGTVFNITGLTGSGTITIVENANDIQVKIFNVTSLSSGDLIKNPKDDSTWSRSYVRDPKKTTPFGNISQTYNLSIPKTGIDNLIK